MTAYPTVSTAQSGGYYMNNLVSTAEFLMSNGWSQAAAAGAAGTIAGEGLGSPEVSGSAGWGLLGWTPPTTANPYGEAVAFHGQFSDGGITDYTTKVSTATLQNDFNDQLADMVSYAQSNSGEAVGRGGVSYDQFIKATDPVQAASWWSAFEGPQVPGSDIRTGVVNQIYQDLNGYKPNSGYALPATLDSATQPSGGSTQCLGVTVPVLGCLGVQVPTIQSLENDILGYLERLGLFILGGIFVIMGLYLLVKDTGKNSNNSNSSSQQPNYGGTATETGADATDAAEIAAL